MSSVYTQPLKLNLGGQTEKLLVHWKGCMLATVEIDWSHDFQKLGKCIYIYIAMLNVFASHKPKEKKDKHEHY